VRRDAPVLCVCGLYLTFAFGRMHELSFLPLALMIFWLIRVRLTGAYRRKPVVVKADVYSKAGVLTRRGVAV
jgi:hypothetical protein